MQQYGTYQSAAMGAGKTSGNVKRKAGRGDRHKKGAETKKNKTDTETIADVMKYTAELNHKARMLELLNAREWAASRQHSTPKENDGFHDGGRNVESWPKGYGPAVL